MSVVFIVVTHGTAAKELLNTCEMLIGKQELVHTVDFVPGESAETLAEKYKSIMAEYSPDTEFLILADLWGGSPFNATNLVANDNDKIITVTGVNVPALIGAFEAREDDSPLKEIAKEAIKAGRGGVRCNYQAREIFKPASARKDSTAPATASQVASDYKGPSKIGSPVVDEANNPDHFTIALLRIDDRLIHGQVATVMAKAANVSRIVVVNDQIAKDKTRTSLLKQACPPDIQAHVVSVAKASRVFNNPMYKGERFLLLVNNPFDVVRLVKEAKWPITSVNVGGISYKEGKTNLSRSVNVNAEEVKAFKELDSLGIECEIRMVMNDSKTDIMKLINEKGL